MGVLEALRGAWRVRDASCLVMGVVAVREVR